jgi:transcriptional regulator NrdR family protein
MINSERNKGLRCPNCDSVRLATEETRARGKMTRRAKRCQVCRSRFYTLEMVELDVPSSPELDRLFER